MGMKLEITLMKSPVGRVPKHRRTIRALGLRRRHQTVRLPDHPAIRGMLRQVGYLVSVREVPEGEGSHGS